MNEIDAGHIDVERLLSEIGRLAAEVSPSRVAELTIGLDTSLERDLGLDSLARVEMVARLEKAFAVALPEQVFAEAETPRDLLRAIARAEGTGIAGMADLKAPARPRGGFEEPREATTLVEVIEFHAAMHPDRVYVRFFEDHGDGQTITYGQLAGDAARVAAGLQELGVAAGDAVAIVLPTGPEYLQVFFGILLAGGVPVPMYPPSGPTHIEEHLGRLEGIINNSLAVALVTEERAAQVAALLAVRVESLKASTTASRLLAAPPSPLRPLVRASDTAFLQYTSGSTGTPKGVVLTHANLLANIRVMGRSLKADPERDVFISWLPLYHDMGLIGACLGTLYFGVPLVLMSPLTFLSRPRRWLEAMSRHQGTLSAAPNFAYELCVRRIGEEDLSGLDLSSWRAALNGAEAVRAETIDRFTEKFAPAGFRANALMPVYGLAECSVGLAFPPLGRGPLIDRVDRETLASSGRAMPIETNGQLVVACGRPLPGHEIRIVDQSGRELPERREGRLQFRGASATSGYFRNREATTKLFDGQWLDSGDLGYVVEGDVFITGRVKDLIIRGGRNIHPAELEEAVGAIEGVRRDGAAAIAASAPAQGTERLVVVAETRIKDAAARERMMRDIRDAVARLAGGPPDEVILAPPGSLLRTSSGKLRRAAIRKLYESGMIGRPRRSLRWQALRLAVGGAWPWMRRLASRAGFMAYAGYAWVLFGAAAPLIWLLAILLPGLSLRWRVLRLACMGLAFAAGIRIGIKGRENLPAGPAVIVANHASYLDALLAVTALPRPVSFVAKAELAGSWITRIPLSRIGVEFVERFDAAKGAVDADRLTEGARQSPLFFFPEGTFTRVPGIMPFRMGAFAAAAEAGVPAVPLAIRGSRWVLHPSGWFPRPGRVGISIGEPIMPDGRGWDAALTLRDQARGWILRHSGEPDLL